MKFFTLFIPLIMLVSTNLYSKYIPSPFNLKANWWEAALEEGVSEEEIIQSLEHAQVLYIEALSKEKNQNIDQDIDFSRITIQRIKAQLKAYSQVKAQPVIMPHLSWVDQGTYSLSDYKDVNARLNSANRELLTLDSEQKRLTAWIAELKQNQSNALAAYLDHPQGSKQKYSSGLEIISRRTRMNFLSEELKQVVQKIKAQGLYIKTLKEEFKHIRSKLDPSKSITIDELANKIRITENELLKVRNDIASLESKIAEELAHETTNTLLLSLYEQQVISKTIGQAILRSQLGFSKLLESVVQSSDNTLDPKSKRMIVNTWHTFISQTEQSAKLWKAKSESDMSKSSQLLLQPVEDKLNINKELFTSASKAIADLKLLDSELRQLNLALELVESTIPTRGSLFAKFKGGYKGIYSKSTSHLKSIFTYSLFELSGVPITLKGIFKGIFSFFIIYTISRFGNKWLSKLLQRRKNFSAASAYTVARLTHYLTIIIAALVALSAMGLSMSNFAIILGALSVGIGFGLQNIANNFISGLTILFQKNVKMNDFIETESGLVGKVVDISIQHTTLHTWDGTDVLIPNSAINNNNLINWTKQNSYRRFRIPFGVAYGSDTQKVRASVTAESLKLDFTVKKSDKYPDPTAWLVGFGDSSLNFELVVWVNMTTQMAGLSIKAALTECIEHALKKDKITIPFPQRDLHLKTITSEVSKGLK